MTAVLETILLVDDDPDIREIAQLGLEAVGGFKVTACGSGPEAVERIAEVAPDLVLLDFMMPGMDGAETLRALRAVPGGEHVPVVFLTAKVRSGEVKRYLELGAMDVIPKPFDPMTLSDWLGEIWARRGR